MKRFLLFAVSASFLIISCQKLLFREDESTRDLFLNDFHAVKFYGIYNIVFIQDSTNRLFISGKNDISSIVTVIRDDTLFIDDHKKLSFNPNKNTLVLHFSNLDFMMFHDPVNVSNTDTIRADQFNVVAVGEIAEVRLVFKCNHFYVVNNSNTLGYFHFIGKAESCWIWNRYGSCMYADSLICKEAAVYNESVGDVNINASALINASIRGPGNIYYHGNPVINIIEKRGKGNVLRID